MPRHALLPAFRAALVAFSFCLLTSRGWADDDGATDGPIEPPPPVLKPAPLAPELKQKYAALRLFAQGKMMEKARRPIEAAALYEKALDLDPFAAGILKALAPLSFQLDRTGKGLEFCRRALDADPEDFDLAYRYGQTLRDLGRKPEALAALALAAKAPEAKSRPAVQAEMLYALGALQEELNQHAA